MFDVMLAVVKKPKETSFGLNLEVEKVGGGKETPKAGDW